MQMFDPIVYNGVPTANIFKSYGKYFDEVAASFVLRKYFISGNPRPELLSYQLYGDSSYYWILLYLNGIYDPFHGWIKSQEQVHTSTQQKYKNFPQKENTVLYHVDTKGKKYQRMSEYPIGSGNWYDIGDTAHLHLQHQGTLAPVSAIEHELNENENKRNILILSPGDLQTFLDALTRRMEKVRRGN
ncbi:baseplate wedge subunit [Aeromonas phage phiAS5]|uniref:Baseplate wedge subunit n=1 Tax=Aeromonas phage phiAS5 TaxID=879630 RepID=E1A285_9CAUD|nr:baseplate wedge subunit [Aeromonas phage phiAS5]ADM80174.1 baseplate wedge subunit [Aeromonas phage phiAS5]